MFRNNAAKHVWWEYRRLITGERHDMDGEDSNNEKEHETEILFLARFDDWTMTVLKCLRTDENRGRTRHKNVVGTLQRFLQITMKQIIGSLYKSVEDWEPEDLVLSQDY